MPNGRSGLTIGLVVPQAFPQGSAVTEGACAARGDTVEVVYVLSLTCGLAGPGKNEAHI